MYNEQIISAHSPIVRINTPEIRMGMFKTLELLILGEGGRWNSPKNPTQPNPVTLPWATITAGNLSFFFLGNRLLKGTSPGVGARNTFTIQVFSRAQGDGSTQIDLPGVMSPGGDSGNGHCSRKTQNHQHGQFWAAWLCSPPQVLSGETCRCWKRVGLCIPIWREPLQGAGVTGLCSPPGWKGLGRNSISMASSSGSDS